MVEDKAVSDKFLLGYLGKLIELNFRDDTGKSIHIRCVLVEVSPPFVKVRTLTRENVLRIDDIISLSDRQLDNGVRQ